VQDFKTDSHLDDDRCHEAAIARDHRFDGLFFVAVRTTRLYCRPICPGRPKPGNVEFFRHAAGAEAAGYRPCLRCRPEDAPHLPSVREDRSAARLAASDAASEGIPPVGAAGGRGRNAGPSPAEAVRNGRLDFSRKLVVETGLPLASIARISSFRSRAEFAAAFEARFRRPPSWLRRSRPEGVDGEVELMLPYRPPLDWQALLDFHRHHLIHGLEAVDRNSYERVFELGPAIGVFRVDPDPTRHRLRLRVLVNDPVVLSEVHRRVRRMLDLDADPMGVGERFASHPALGSLWAERPGLRIARGWDPFEVSVSTILGQLVSTTQGRALVRQLVENYGKPAVHPVTGGPVRLFPSPGALASSGLELVRTTQTRKQAIRSLAGLVASGALDLGGDDVDEVKWRLLSLPGVGPWTSEYIGLRALGDADAFPGTDLILKRSLASYAGIDLDSIRPWRGYVAACLWASHGASPAQERGVP
jgi:AraC family transcriptional regulator of adaptative response / DNA-3-methyladenine glycosylase II